MAKEPNDEKPAANVEKSFQEQLAELEATPVAGTDMTEKEAHALIAKGQADAAAKHAGEKEAKKDEVKKEEKEEKAEKSAKRGGWK